MRVVLAALLALALIAPAAHAGHGLTSSGVVVHQVSDSPTSLNRTINFWETFPPTAAGNQFRAWWQLEARPRWDANGRMTLPSGLVSNDSPANCNFLANGDSQICSATSYPGSTWAGLMQFTVNATTLHITSARIRIDDYKSGASTPGQVCRVSTYDTMTGQPRVAETNCGWFADSVLHHEVGHVLGLDHPAIGILAYSPMASSYHWQATAGCNGHACVHPDQHDQDYLAFTAWGHADASGPNPGGAGGSVAAKASDVRENPRVGTLRDSKDLREVSRNGFWQSVDPHGRMKARWRDDNHIEVREEIPAVTVLDKESPLEDVPLRLRAQVERERE